MFDTKANGSNFKSLENSMKIVEKKNGKPKAILIAETIKGKGIKLWENKPHWHYWNEMSKEDIEAARKDQMAQRDIFIKTIISELKKGNDNLVFLSADFGAPALDELRADHPKNFFHCRFSEQAMIDMAVGLAIAGKNRFAMQWHHSYH